MMVLGDACFLYLFCVDDGCSLTTIDTILLLTYLEVFLMGTSFSVSPDASHFFLCVSEISFVIYFRLYSTYVGIILYLVSHPRELSSTIDSSLWKLRKLLELPRDGYTFLA